MHLPEAQHQKAPRAKISNTPSQCRPSQTNRLFGKLRPCFARRLPRTLLIGGAISCLEVALGTVLACIRFLEGGVEECASITLQHNAAMHVRSTAHV